MKTIKERAQSLLDQWRESSDWNESVSAFLRELIDAPEPEPVARDLRMSAYHYNFEETGVPSIDRILSAVACAGKAYHHTEYWNDETTPYAGHVGTTPVEWIQNAANDAAKVYAAPPAPSVPDSKTLQFLTDVLTAAGLLRHGKKDAGLATRIADESCRIRQQLFTQPEQPADLVHDASPHPDDIAVDIFAAAMKAKMEKQRIKGYGGWQDKEKCPANYLRNLLIDHVTKGDPVDVGNFAMMLFNRGDSTAACETCGGTGQCDEYQQYAAAACRDEIRARSEKGQS